MWKLFRTLQVVLFVAGLSFSLYGCAPSISGDNKATPTKQALSYPQSWDDHSIFHAQYQAAGLKLQTMSLDEKIGQLFLVRTPVKNQTELLRKHQFCGYVLYKRDIDNHTKESLKKQIQTWVSAAKVSPLIAVDEEGGTVNRISSNPNFRSSRFLSPQQLYARGGMRAIESNTREMVCLLEELGFNVNLAPVADIATAPTDFMYQRSFGKEPKPTAEFIQTIFNNTKNSKVSFVMKHFPGYGNNRDTHKETVGDMRSLEQIITRDLVPFKAGIKTGADAILVSHNIVTSIDSKKPASLSKGVITLARKECGFTGIVMTDNLDMRAVRNYTKNSACVEAFLAGNDVIMISDYLNSLKEIKVAMKKGIITEDELNRRVFRILAWKYNRGILKE